MVLHTKATLCHLLQLEDNSLSLSLEQRLDERLHERRRAAKDCHRQRLHSRIVDLVTATQSHHACDTDENLRYQLKSTQTNSHWH